MAKIKIGLSDQDKINMANDVYDRVKTEVDGYVQEKDTEIDGFMDTVTNNFNELSGQVEGTLGEQNQEIADFKTEVNGEIADQNALIASMGQPKYYSTLPTSNVGLVVYSDGYIYSWDSTSSQYVSTGIVYQATQLSDENQFMISKGYLLKEELEKFNMLLSDDTTKVDDHYVGNTGDLGILSGWVVYKLVVGGFDKIDIIIKDFSSMRMLYAFYDSSYTFISFVEANTYTTSAISIPSNARYMNISFVATNTSKILVLLENDIISRLKNEYITRNETLSLINGDKYNLINLDNCVADKYVQYNNGAINNLTNFSITGFIKVKGGERYMIEGGNSTSQCAFFDKSFAYISGKVTGANNYVDAPSNAEYIIWCCPTANMSTAKLYLYIKTASEIADEKVYDFSKQICPLFQGKTVNLIDISKYTDGYYVNYYNGILTELATYSTTDYIEVVPNLVYEVNNGSLASQCAFYDENYDYISGIVTGSTLKITAPNNAKYIRWCCETTKKNNASLILVKEDGYTVDTTIGILQGVINAYAMGASKIIVKAGNYDIISEYEAKYGNDYFENYTTKYNNLVNGMYDTGIWLENVEIKFESGAYVTCNYTGNNANVKGYFCAFAVGRNVIIDGLNLVASELRYGMHPDFNNQGNDEIYFVLRNCDLSFVKGDWNCQSIGAGLGVHSNWLIENNIFRTPLNGNVLVMRIHNNVSANAVSKIVIKDNYIDGKGHFGINYYSTSEKITNVLISGNSWINPPTKVDETSGSYDNINLIIFNNETRT